MGFVFMFTGTAEAQGYQIHRVEVGENLSRIAAGYGTNVDELMKLNRFMEDQDRLFTGQVLVVPEKGELTDEQIPAGSKNVPVKEQQDNTQALVNAQENDTKSGQTVESPARLRPDQLMQYYSSSFLHTGPKDIKKVALTFDDGPDAHYTPLILDVLSKQGVPATFFLVGNLIENHIAVMNRIHAEGHIIASHSWSHADFTQLAPEDALLEIHRTERAIFSLTGELPVLFRAPWGKITEDNLNMLVALGYKKIFWSTDSLDWSLKDADQVLINTLSNTGRGAIILMHSAGGRDQNLDATVAALPDLIYTLRVQGYEFVTVDELLSIPAYR